LSLDALNKIDLVISLLCTKFANF